MQGRFGGKPAPTVSWTKNDEELKADEEISISTTSRTLNLTIGKTKREHSGRYCVTVENVAGSRKGICTVTVVGEWIQISTGFTLYCISSTFKTVH